ncbi:FAD dependent oxidoreductase [Spinellus fusiger]|nr:FAD dependent oxidoreductase [Spinellus fusiger]
MQSVFSQRVSCVFSLGKRYASTRVDNVVVGGGVVGLALAEKLTRELPAETTVVVEKNSGVGEETSSRNSEVIHAGLYYPSNSLKTTLCRQGNRQLYALATRHTIPHQRIGKWIVAQSHSQHHYLCSLHEKANASGVETYFLSPKEAQHQEPALAACHSVLVSPSTAIIDSHALMQYFVQTIEEQQGHIALSTRVESIQRVEKEYKLTLATPTGKDTVVCRRLFNAAGLHAATVSDFLMPGHYALYYAKGYYYAYHGLPVFKHLVYPCPDPHLAGLGTHLTLDMAGQMKFGPNVEYVDSLDYSLPQEDRRLHAEFTQAIHRYWPTMDPSKLHLSTCGIR